MVPILPILVAALACSLCAAPASAQTLCTPPEPAPLMCPPPAPEAAAKADGQIIDRHPCELPFDDYEAWLDFIRARRAVRGDGFDEGRFRAAYPAELYAGLSDGSIDCQAITYRSDGLEVAGYALQPVHGDARPLPAIIYNRGGNRDFGRLVFLDLMDFAGWARQGYLVLASQYRGTSGSGGRDEFGGADVHDVLNLFPVATQLGADMGKVFMAGSSRGGMMTYLALKAGAPVKAAAVIGAPADLVQLGTERPEMQALYRELMPGFDRDGQALMRERSALSFAEQLNAPLLILHGGADARVPAEQALTLAQRLQQAHKAFELVVYAQDDHGLARNSEDSHRRMMGWFKAHLE